MVEDGRYLRLYVKLRDNPVYSHPTALRLWIHLLIEAKAAERPPGRERRILWRGHGMKLERGMVTVNQRGLADELGCGKGTIYRAFKLLESEGLIRAERGAHFTLVSVCNWERYQPEWGEERGSDGYSRGDQVGTQAGHPKRKRDIEKRSKKCPAHVKAIWQAAPERAKSRSSQHEVEIATAKLSDVERQQVVRSLKAWADSDEWRRENGRFIPGLHRWIKNQRWRQMPPKPELPQYYRAPDIEDDGEKSPPPINWQEQIRRRGGKE